ncbi:50S ribosomal protein L3 [Patescibacteria group bacterium]|nr:50S ribosomal protein L3 [Patescibacteria group bacterium]MBU1703505.1 50S ribosomal protein L3 [Patescibacteria group bacterium]MBU1953412.1 50S ribosomal protein L3 [Patescibacteria group bacterium]
MTGILGRKIGMTRVIQDDGRVIPMTVVQCTPNVVTQVKTAEKDGYPAIVLGFCELSKPGKTRKYRYMKEFRLEEGVEVKKGDSITVDIFNEGDEVKVTGTSKGKGFQGVMKRYNFHGGPGSHGSHHVREPGSVGACASPGRIHRGKKLPGRMGGATVTLSSASVVYLDKKRSIIGIKGAIPGGANSLVTIKKVL